MDQITQAAFRDLWQLWKDNQGIGDDRHAWDHLTAAAREITEQAAAAEDPEFIVAFAIDVLDSLDRINRQVKNEEGRG